MNYRPSNLISVIALLVFLLLYSFSSFAEHGKASNKRKRVRERITSKYPDQLTYPQKKNRMTFAQFGYNLYEFQVPIFPVTKFITPDKLGYQSYGKPNREMEKNGALYTCRGGFIDISHVRTAIDWTVYLTFKILTDSTDLELPWEAGTLKLHFNFKNLDKLTQEDIAAMAQKIAFERLTWHEIASWHYHKPYHHISEQHSVFTPEDTYSNFIGTEIGKRVALRILKDTINYSYSEIATDEIQKMLHSLVPVKTKKYSRKAYDIVDLNKQRKLPETERNPDVWYDSRIVFHDQRYIFKRYMDIGPKLTPWLVPKVEKTGCSCDLKPEILDVPQQVHNGKSFYSYYQFTITPDTNLFYDHKKERRSHQPFNAFTTQHLDEIMTHISIQMAQALGTGFDKRDSKDPTVHYTNVKKVFLK